MRPAKSTLSILLLSCVSAMCQTGETIGFTNVVNTPIPDANPNGIFSTIDVSGVSGSISNVSVYLDISGGWNGDLYGYLTSSNGGFAVLLNRVGKSASDPIGYGDAGMNITLDDHATTDFHDYGGNGGNPITGIFQPDGRNVDPQLVFDTDSRTSLLGSFDNLDPNATWTLFLSDLATGYDSQLVQWGLTFDTVPEPSPFALFSLAALMALAWRRRGRKPSNRP